MFFCLTLFDCIFFVSFNFPEHPRASQSIPFEASPLRSISPEASPKHPRSTPEASPKHLRSTSEAPPRKTLPLKPPAPLGTSRLSRNLSPLSEPLAPLKPPVSLGISRLSRNLLLLSEYSPLALFLARCGVMPHLWQI